MPKTLILPGLKPALDLLQSEPGRIAKIYLKKDWPGGRRIEDLASSVGIRIEYVESAVLDRLCGREARKDGQISHQGVVAILAETRFASIAELAALTMTAPLPLAIALDQIQDPGNLGAIARTAYGLGCAGLVLPAHNSASIGPGALRASAGALALLPICAVTNLARALDEAEEAGMFICGAAHDAGNQRSANAFDFHWQLPAVLTLGNEKNGLRPGVAKRCQIMLDIPLARQFDSLNVAQAAAILIALCAAQN